MPDFSMVVPLFAQAGGNEAPPNPGGGDFFSSTLFLILPIVAAMYLILLRPQQREAKQKQDLLNSLKKNDRVVTIGGLIGVVANVKDDEVTVKIDEDKDVKVRFTKSSIAQVIAAKEGDKTPATGEKASA